MWFLVLLGFLITVNSSSTFTVWPSTTVPIISSQFTRLDGYGLVIQTPKLSLGYYKAVHTSHGPGELLQLEGTWVYERKVDLWEINYSFYENRRLAVGLGLNKADSERLGWQIYGEKNFHNLIFARLGFRRVWMKKPVDGIIASFGVNILELVKRFKELEVRK
jgi:hypothetical protein